MRGIKRVFLVILVRGRYTETESNVSVIHRDLTAGQGYNVDSIPWELFYFGRYTMSRGPRSRYIFVGMQTKNNLTGHAKIELLAVSH